MNVFPRISRDWNWNCICWDYWIDAPSPRKEIDWIRRATGSKYSSSMMRANYDSQLPICLISIALQAVWTRAQARRCCRRRWCRRRTAACAPTATGTIGRYTVGTHGGGASRTDLFLDYRNERLYAIDTNRWLSYFFVRRGTSDILSRKTARVYCDMRETWLWLDAACAPTATGRSHKSIDR